MNTLEKIALRRLGLLTSSTPLSGSESVLRAKMIAMAQFRDLGYRVSNHESFGSDLLANFAEVVEELKIQRGGDVEYVPLFTGFPNKVPSTRAFAKKMDAWFIASLVSLDPDAEQTIVLTNGVVVPAWFASEGFGAGHFGREKLEAYEKGAADQEAREGDVVTQWRDLKIVNAGALNSYLFGWLEACLYSKSSIKEALKEDVLALLGHFGLKNVDGSRISFKETKALVMRFAWEQGVEASQLADLTTSPTDLLRMFAALTDTDISLSTKIKFPKMSRKQRRKVLSALNGFDEGALLEQMGMYHRLWLVVGKSLHVGEYKKKYKKVFEVFTKLRKGKPQSFESQVEAALKMKTPYKVVALLQTRPSLFARRLQQMVLRYPEYDIVEAFAEVAHKVPLKNLMVLQSYIGSLPFVEERTIVNKKGKIVVVEHGKKPADEVCQEMAEVVGKVLKDTVKCVESSGTKVWIDPLLQNFTVPLQQRKASDGLLTYGRGSRISFDNKPVLRMFTYWHESDLRTDLDLSAIMFDQDLNYVGQVSYTNLVESGIVHSGDLTSAPYGAAEFIDMTLDKLDERARYVAPQIYRYSGEKFEDLQKSYAGWMWREKATRDRKSFDIKTVQYKFNMVGSGNFAMPFILDMVEKQIVMTDLYVGQRGFGGGYRANRVESSVSDVSKVCKGVLSMCHTRPNMLDLVTHYAASQGHEVVEDRQEADVTYGVSDCDFTVGSVEEILSEML